MKSYLPVEFIVPCNLSCYVPKRFWYRLIATESGDLKKIYTQDTDIYCECVKSIPQDNKRFNVL